MRRSVLLIAAAWVLLSPGMSAQGLTGALIGTVHDEQGAAVPGAHVRLTSPALLGGPAAQTTNGKGQWRFPVLPPGAYVLDIEFSGFSGYHEDDIRIGVNATIERTAVLTLAGLTESIAVQGAGSRIEARDAGLGTRFGLEDIKAIPVRRASMFDFIRATPGVSPTSPSSATNVTISAFGSGTNENQFLIDGTNFTCPCSGVARAEPGVDFIQEVQVQSAGASVEFGSVQGAVINVVTRQGSDRFLYDASYYAQPSALTSRPVLRPLTRPSTGQTGYQRTRYRDLTTNLGGPIVRDRLWFFTGYQYLRDHDSQPGTDAAFPRTYEQNKIFGKLTWRLAPGVQLLQSFHNEHWVNPDPTTSVTPFEATLRRSATVPAITFGHLTHTLSANTLWDVRGGRFVFTQDVAPSNGIRDAPGRTDSITGVSSGAPPQFTLVTVARTNAKATLSHYQPGLLGVDHQWRIGAQFEHGGHHAVTAIPTGVRLVDSNGAPSLAISAAASHAGGLALTSSAFVSDALTIGNRLTVNAGLRFDHSRALTQELSAVDALGRETGDVVRGGGTLYTWNVMSPRLGVTTKLTADGRTMLRASYGRFSQGVMTGELEQFHPGASPTTTAAYVPATAAYTRIVSVIGNNINLQLDPATRAPRTDEYSAGVDRAVGRAVAVAVAYVRKNGTDFIGWTDTGGQYREETRTVDGQRLPVFVLVNATADRRFLLTNPAGYSLTYNGLVMVVEKRRSHGWQAFGSYTLSKAYGLQASSGATAAGTQTSTVSPPQPLTFGRDPNDLTNARGRLPNDRPHVFRVMGSVDVPRSGVVVAANLQHFTGKPWAATAQVALAQNPQQRVLLEPRGSQRLSSQTLLDVRVSKTIAAGTLGRVELLLDLLNALNDTAEEGIATDNRSNANFAQPTLFVDPRRAMLSVRLNVGR
jgi:hypothetical protein